ncbi:MAG: DUF1800 domain-containing protein [Chloroflexota bacterium]
MAIDPDTTRKVGHLLRRAGFGAAPSQIAAYAAKGLPATIDALVNYGQTPNPLDATLNHVQGDLIDLHNLLDVQTWWIYRMIHTTRPLEEKMTLFWHGHFATANYKVNNPAFMQQQNVTQRSLALGSFGDMMTAMAKDPAMLIWLDGASNRKGAPNENFAREMMELFSVGIGHYTEDDVHAGAKAFTGWNLNRQQGTFQFNARQHDTSAKTFRGTTGNLNGDDIIKNVVADPATAQQLALKLFTFFAYDHPDPAVIQPFADVYLKSNLAIKPVVQAILSSDVFYSEQAMQGHLKSPTEYVLGLVHGLNGQVGERNLAIALRNMGQELFNPPNVGGWPGGPEWIDAGTMAARFNFGALLSAAQKGAAGGGFIDPESLVQAAQLTDWGSIVDLFGGSLTAGLTDASKAALASYTTGTASGQNLSVKLRGLLHLISMTPEYQVA